MNRAQHKNMSSNKMVQLKKLLSRHERELQKLTNMRNNYEKMDKLALDDESVLFKMDWNKVSEKIHVIQRNIDEIQYRIRNEN